jgi:acetoacetate decarboxylase
MKISKKVFAIVTFANVINNQYVIIVKNNKLLKFRVKNKQPIKVPEKHISINFMKIINEIQFADNQIECISSIPCTFFQLFKGSYKADQILSYPSSIDNIDNGNYKDALTNIVNRKQILNYIKEN